ncbi:MAG: hypothetical protein AAF806_21145 [Bacteroidota bacterium]
METLKEIVKALTPKRVRYVSLLSKQLNTDSKLMQLYQGIQSGKIVDRSSAIDHLYPDDEEGNSKFTKLKYHFKKRAISTILLVEINDEDGKKERKKAFFDCLRTFVIAYFLILLHARKAGIQLLQQKLKTMRYHDFTFLCLESAKIMRQHYSAIVGDLKKAEQYDQLVMDYLELYVLETKVDGYFHQLMGHYVKEKTSNALIHDLSTQYSNALKGKLPLNAPSNLIFKLKMIEVIQSISVHDYERGILICEEAVNLLLLKESKDFTAISAMYFQWITGCLNLGQFESCKALVGQLMKYLKVGDVNWFKGLQILMEVSFYTQDYQGALDYYNKVKVHKNFKKLSQSNKEKWLIYEAYLHLLMLWGQLDFTEVFKKRAIRLHRFFNSVPLAQKDKQGMNLPIMIYWLLILIHQQKYDEVVDKSESLQKYVNRYLKDGYERTKVFLKMIVNLCKSNYDYHALSNEIEQYLHSLSISQNQIHRDNEVIEIIPYEYLWKMLIGSLKKEEYPTNSLIV